MPTHEPKTPEQFALAALMETVEQTVTTLLNGAPNKKSPWMFALVAHNADDDTLAYLSSNKDPRMAAGMMMDAALRITGLTNDEIAEVQRRARQKKH
jgi:hypothetical protein